MFISTKGSLYQVHVAGVIRFKVLEPIWELIQNNKRDFADWYKYFEGIKTGNLDKEAMTVAYCQIMPSNQRGQQKVSSNVAATPLKVHIDSTPGGSDDDDVFFNKDSIYYGNPFESEVQMKAKLKSENFGDIAKNVLANSVQLAAVKN